MATANINKNEWFNDASTPLRDIAEMLVNLDNKRLIPDEMRQAIHHHALNQTDTLPMGIAAISQAIAAAHSGFGLSDTDAAQASWAVAALAESLSAMVALKAQFGELVDPGFKVVQAESREVSHA